MRRAASLLFRSVEHAAALPLGRAEGAALAALVVVRAHLQKQFPSRFPLWSRTSGCSRGSWHHGKLPAPTCSLSLPGPGTTPQRLGLAQLTAGPTYSRGDSVLRLTGGGRSALSCHIGVAAGNSAGLGTPTGDNEVCQLDTELVLLNPGLF